MATSKEIRASLISFLLYALGSQAPLGCSSLLSTGKAIVFWGELFLSSKLDPLAAYAIWKDLNLK